MGQPTADDLARIPLLASLDPHVRERLAARFEVAEYTNGERVVVEGEAGIEVFVIESGQATATQRERGLVRMMGSSDVFGEIALLGKGKRTATITASSPMVVWVLRSHAIQFLNTEFPDVTDALATAMQDRLATEWT